jgi:DNA-binding transcriptional regulator YdaS (Cro superfamily)
MVYKRQPYNAEAVKRAAEILGSKYKLAQLLQVCYSTVFRWCNNQNAPSVHHCILIEKVTRGAVKKEEILTQYSWDKFKDFDS